MNKKCLSCGQVKPLKSFEKYQSGTIAHTCLWCRIESSRTRKRLKFFEEYGGKCACCGESNPYFLTLDHIYGKTSCKESGDVSIRKAMSEGWPKDRYQILCFNCNMSKGFFGECAHKSHPSICEA